jgi:peptide/nickel transport system ATP-binding protein
MSAVLEVRNLARHYAVRRGAVWSRPVTLRAVDGVSFSIAAGRTLGLVGESGCGKSTTAKLALGLVPASAGEVRFDGKPLPDAGTAEWRRLRTRMQMVFQDPLAALDRRLKVGDQIAEPLAIHGKEAPDGQRARVLAIMDAVGLKPHQYDRYPHELSGGQRQRIVLARALILEPTLLVCDEPISALDVSIQAQVINLLLDLQASRNLSYLFISHDLKVVRQVSHEVAVMYLGRIVEQGTPDALFANPAHPYTQALVSAIPVARSRGTARPRIILQGDPPDPVNLPSGCAFHPRCPLATAQCRAQAPALTPFDDGRLVACHRAGTPITLTNAA